MADGPLVGLNDPDLVASYHPPGGRRYVRNSGQRLFAFVKPAYSAASPDFAAMTMGAKPNVSSQTMRAAAVRFLSLSMASVLPKKPRPQSGAAMRR